MLAPGFPELNLPGVCTNPVQFIPPSSQEPAGSGPGGAGREGVGLHGRVSAAEASRIFGQQVPSSVEIILLSESGTDKYYKDAFILLARPNYVTCFVIK